MPKQLVRMAMGQSRQSLWHRFNHFHVISMSSPCHFHIFPSVWRGDVWPIATAEDFSSSRHNRPPTAPPEESPGILRLSWQQDHLNSTNVTNFYQLLQYQLQQKTIALPVIVCYSNQSTRRLACVWVSFSLLGSLSQQFEIKSLACW